MPGRETSEFAVPRRAVATTVMLALVAVALVAAGRAQAGDGIVSLKRQMDNQRERAITDYWTKRRLREAKPLEASVPGGGVSVSARSTGSDPGDPGYLPAMEPGGPVPRWHSGLPPSRPTPLLHPFPFASGEVVDSATPPNSTSGKVFGFLPGFGPFECSATAITAPNRSLVFTASHCLMDPGYAFAKRFVFVPAYRDGARPYGTWVGEEFFSPRPWVQRESYSFDFGAAVVRRQNGTALEDVVGARGFAYNQPREQTYDAHGYPGNRLDAQRMWHCVSDFAGTSDPQPNAAGPDASAIGCDMGLGASGGGWIVEGQFVNSVTSFEYRNHPKILFGPYLQARARRLVVQAGGA